MATRLTALVMLIAAALFCPQPVRADNSEPPGNIDTFTYRVIASHPHDPDAFTQGLVIDDGVLYEGTGINGKSSLRRVDLETGKVLQLQALPAQFFGEGITLFGDKIIQLTWKSRYGFVYDKNSFKLLRVFAYPFEGWGITHDGKNLITSDGTAVLRFITPHTLAQQRSITVTDGNKPVALLNELEYVGESIYANVWKTDRIAIIEPDTGKVTGWLDLAGILPQGKRSVAVLNGIAYDAGQEALYVTGKLWPEIFEIEPVRVKAKSTP
jgi:glutamine cyclotransferase